MLSTIYHHQFSYEGKPLVVIHGLFGCSGNLGAICRQLSKQYAVYAIDLPNHGRSQHTETTSLNAMAEAVVEWMSQVGLDKAHFLGHSLGGKVSMEIALRYPEKVDQLIVVDIAPVAYHRRHDDVFAAFQAINLDQLDSRAEADKQMQPLVSEPSIRSFLLKNLEKKEGRWSWRINLSGLMVAYDQLISGNTTEFPPFFGKVLFIKGEFSPYILPEHRELILSLFPQASVKVINNTQHWLHVEKPNIFGGIVERFLQA
ncbi:acyl-CoA esterase [Candidatus Endobugula sertula]|uniref:Acyl-CoA esterase n=1 Tax=Candidatus Endobugula sertula TaxID=62101 RepID=A0A1D2QLV5_9GAMM|nr:acyl-CoA esterase [Candidatus Endobugula sertula]